MSNVSDWSFQYSACAVEHCVAHLLPKLAAQWYLTERAEVLPEVKAMAPKRCNALEPTLWNIDII